MDIENRKKLNKEINEFIKDAKLNRENFTEPFKNKFEKAKTKEERAKIVIKLIQLEPSHLSEAWIFSEVIEWLRRSNCIDYLKGAFIYKGERKRPTQRQMVKDTLDRLLVRYVDKKYNEAKDKITKDRIFANLTLDSENHIFLGINEKFENKSEDYDLQAMYKKRYYSYKEKEKRKNDLPFPYFGLDVSTDRGVLDMMFHRK